LMPPNVRSASRLRYEVSRDRRAREATLPLKTPTLEAIGKSAPHQVGTRIGDAARLALLGKLFHQRTLLGGQAGRRQHLELIHQVARRLRTASWDAAPLESQRLASLAVSRNFERYLSAA